ncbi:MAG: transcriptional repressor NrdR [Clostridiaceae bacterium]|nr:transcriptional repressor NrdR [Clostridiaceae bacterium]
MKCPYCSHLEDRVIDSRPTDDGATIRRRRECLGCQKRYTTYEKVEYMPLMVIKKDKSRQPYSREKLMNGILRACEKRPVSIDRINSMIDNIEAQLYSTLEREVTSTVIGEKVMEELRKLDEVAYVRFASVYRQFKDINTFMDELQKIIKENKPDKG